MLHTNNKSPEIPRPLGFSKFSAVTLYGLYLSEIKYPAHLFVTAFPHQHTHTCFISGPAGATQKETWPQSLTIYWAARRGNPGAHCYFKGKCAGSSDSIYVTLKSPWCLAEYMTSNCDHLICSSLSFDLSMITVQWEQMDATPGIYV